MRDPQQHSVTALVCNGSLRLLWTSEPDRRFEGGFCDRIVHL